MKTKKDQPEISKSLSKSTNQFPVVGIGASAGGLDAFRKLVKAIPEDSGMAYVLVQHLDPKHESLLPELLQKVTNIPVLEISDDIKVKPDHIYIIPSNKMLIANDGVLELSPRITVKNQRNLPIDLFFTSLAEIHQTHSIGVVLSGTASDGTLGLKAIKDQGGITFAQDEESAAYEGMPHSAAQAGVVDFILPPEKIPQKILDVNNSLNRGDGVDGAICEQDEDVYRQVLSLLRIRKGTDFTYYKQPTIRRRILRRMAFNKTEEPGDYLKFLKQNKTEQDALYQDLLIPVTSFFRDPASFDNLCEWVFPLIVKNKIAGESIRIWVAACSTGEEAYSIAICFKEYLEGLTQTLSNGERFTERVQIFATDISEPAIVKARAGIYTKNEVEGLNPDRLKEFFTKTNGSYQVNKDLREMCVFAGHNFIKDPPFGKMDFISCRNVLIYMEPYLQKKALTTFHYSLNPKGFMLLGKSETTSSVTDLFSSAAKNDKLFSRKDVPGRFMHVASQRSERNLSQAEVNPKSDPDKSGRTDFQKTADDIMLSRYTPAGVVVNEEMDIVHFRGSTSPYLEQSPGKPSHNLLKMAKMGLAFELRNILHKAKKGNASVIKDNIPVQADNGQRLISIEAIPLPNIAEPHYLVLFHDHTFSSNQQSAISNKKGLAGKASNEDRELLVKQLELELAQTREDMRSITEDQEAANEELQSANEELLSGSEELQSLNEELETNKEELQSTNEELTIVNQEMISLNEQVTEARDYAEAIITTLREPLLVLDKKLRIKTANDSFYKSFLVNEQETEGKLIYDLGNKQWNIPALRTLLEKILPEKTKFSDFEVNHIFPNIGERVMLLNAREITAKAGEEKLILLAIEDITEKAAFEHKQELFTEELEKQVKERTADLHDANESLQKKNQEIALSKYNKHFLTEFSEKFSAYKLPNEFFNSLVQFIADTTRLNYVFVGKLVQNEKDGYLIETIAITAFGKLAENIIYPLPDGPCEQVIRGMLYSYPKQCREKFPKNKTIKQFKVEGYLGYPLYDEQGSAVGLIAVMHEKEIEDSETVSSVLKIVARRAEIELERIKHGEQLEINNRILEEKNEELVKINKELESFTYLSSHDLQEPLRKIQTFANRILEKEYGELSGKGKDYFHRMQDAAHRMQTLLEDLLAYSHTNITDRKFTKTQLNSIVEEVKVELAETILEKKAVIKSNQLGEGNVNFSQFRQVMNNLIANALKFSKPGVPPHILIKSEIAEGSKFQNAKLSPTQNYCHISFTDKGIGFDPHYREQIFNVFQRLHGKDDYAGTGIGLAIVKKIVENHNGFVTATSEVNEGATFDIYIPA
jgi:two-component system, chemotaxis family, CheB/CheR fusion protein